jgi:hypothetical protein
VSETCKKTIGVWQLKDCGRPAKGRGDVIAGKNVPLCGVHLAAIKHRADNFERRKREIEKRDARDRRAIALSAARDEVVRAAQAWAGSVDSADRRLCEMRLGAAVAALARLEKP